MLPLRIETDYQVFRARIMHDVTRIAVPRMAGSRLLRVDAKDDPQLLELAALLGLSSAALLNKRKLRAKLQRFARRLSVEKQSQLSALLGRWVRAPDEHLVEQWVSSQMEAISTQIDLWLARAASSESAPELVAFTGAAQASRARLAASAAVLALNTRLLANVATANGVGEYRWRTAGDDAVRENHAALDGLIQRWAEPPPGGGTKPGDAGHPGEGYGCRCEAEPLVILPS